VTEVKPFTFPVTAQAVRVLEIDGSPWFVAADVCAVLELEDVRRAVERLEVDDRSQTPVVDSAGRLNPKTWIVSEPGLYDLVIRSDKPQARDFRRWVFHDVLPAIRKHGGYVSPGATLEQRAVILGINEAQARVLHALNGIVDPAWLESKARHLAARALGEEPEEDLAKRLLTVGEYLEERGVTATAARKLAPTFGKRLKSLYLKRHGEPPGVSRRFVDGAQRDVAVYTESDRSLFDAVWSDLTDAAAA
jgi:prophage antirepressor-like protein